MLFSNEQVARFISRSFEPVWESVRPVPLVHIDFGNGTTVTRTLNGNIATHVCTADGLVLDTLPGIYTPQVYVDRLNQFRLLANYVDQQGKEQRATRLRDYHKGQADALRKKEIPPVLVNMAPVSKMAIESGLKAALRPSAERSTLEAASSFGDGKPGLESAEDLANWKALAEDTTINETVRRQQIHEWLADQGPIRPEGLTRWLYKNVLHADLDDPYLGLGSVLFASYPFKDQVH